MSAVSTSNPMSGVTATIFLKARQAEGEGESEGDPRQPSQMPGKVRHAAGGKNHGQRLHTVQTAPSKTERPEGCLQAD